MRCAKCNWCISPICTQLPQPARTSVSPCATLPPLSFGLPVARIFLRPATRTDCVKATRLWLLQLCRLVPPLSVQASTPAHLTIRRWPRRGRTGMSAAASAGILAAGLVWRSWAEHICCWRLIGRRLGGGGAASGSAAGGSAIGSLGCAATQPGGSLSAQPDAAQPSCRPASNTLCAKVHTGSQAGSQAPEAGLWAHF